jgi:hypothetical protein
LPALVLDARGSEHDDGAPTTRDRPLIVVEATGRTNRLRVENAPGDARRFRHLLADSASTLVPGRSGWDVPGVAGFATWTVAGSGTWFSYTRDGGLVWSVPRRLRRGLLLRAATVLPDRPAAAPAVGLALPVAGRLFVVQFRTISLPEWRSTLRAVGGEVLRFVPHNAHIVRLDPARVGTVAALDFVERIEPYHPAYRLDPALIDWLEGDPKTEADQIRVRVMSFEWGPEGKQRILRAAEALGARVAEYWPSGHILELWVTPEQLRRLAAHDEVLWIDRWGPPEFDMDLVRQDAGDDWLESNFGFCGQGVRGEVQDGGVEETHSDLDGVLLHGSNTASTHGTNAYGIVFGNGDRDGDGDAQATGHMPCPEAQGISSDVDFLGDRFAKTEELKRAPYFASFQTNSWGDGPTGAYTSVSSQLDDIIWRLDLAILQSQGTYFGTRDSRPQAWAKNIISVGGVQHRNTLDTADDGWNSSAAIGPAADGRIKPDVSYWSDGIYTTSTNDGYTNFGGTSAATPTAAGVLGLIVQLWSENVWGTDPEGELVFQRQPHFSTLKALLINNARPYPFSGAAHDLTRVHQGWGRPSARLAHERAARSFVVDEEQPLVLGQSATYVVAVANGESELKVTMTYPDPPGTTSAALHRINDVDLKVTSPGGEIYHGNVGLDVGNASVPGGEPNGVDTVENVFVPNPAAGSWTVEVTAAEVNQDAFLDTPGDDATFALVVTGATIESTCGNGILEHAEQCDDGDLDGATCEDRACSGGGVLACTGSCTYDTTACAGCPVCGDGTCQTGEDCRSCPLDCSSTNASSCGNGICEQGDGEDCVSCPADCNGAQGGKPADRFCCGAGGGENPVPCSDARCNTAVSFCTVTPLLASCCGDGLCQGDETVGSCSLDCAVPTPGEAAAWPGGQLRVSGYDRAADVISLSYGPACQAADHTIEFGELSAASLAAYDWTGQQCGIGTSGSYDWSLAGTPDSIFFVIVGRDATSSGSYGTDGAGDERPEHAGTQQCPAPQDLSLPCS